MQVWSLEKEDKPQFFFKYGFFSLSFALCFVSFKIILLYFPFFVSFVSIPFL
jgi:hypothetical protein